MRMTSFLNRGAITPKLAAGTRDEAIGELVRSLHAAGAFETSQLPDIIAAVLRREQLGSTGIGQGVAIPHSRHSSVGQLVGALGLCSDPSGIPFDAIDGEPVHVLVLLISPQDQPGPHLRALDSVVQAFKDGELLKRLKACTTPDEIWSLISES